MADFQEVYDLYFKDVHKYALSLSRDPHIAEEITQETFFKALKSIDSFRGQCRLYVWLSQTSSIMIDPQECTVTNVTRFSNGMYYLEYRLPYDFNGLCADCCRTDSGEIHVTEYRPILARKDTENGVLRDYIIDPVNNIMYTDTGTQVPLTAFYLGCPDKGDAVLIWSAEEAYPMATPEMEETHLYQNVFR